MPIRNEARQRGFTLLELLIVLLVFTFIVGGILNVLGKSQSRYQFEQDVAEMQQTGRNCIDIMEREIRLAGFPKASYYDSNLNWTASNSNRVAQGFISIGASSMTFETDVDEDGIVDVVQYSYDSTAATLRRSAVDKPSGGGTPTASPQILANNVTAVSFTYLDSAGSTTTDPASVQRVQISFNLTTSTVNRENRRARTLTMQTVATIRNS
jgi:prepilin-type N-terminal cleavage/methylation domain-containing protein